MNFFSNDHHDGKEWRHLFRNAIDWDSIIPLYYPSFPTEDGYKNKEELLEFFEQIIDATGEWTGETLAVRARELDHVGSGTLSDGIWTPSEPLKQIYKEAKDLGLFASVIDRHYGGMGLPVVVGMFGFAQISRACISSSCQLGFFGSIADMIERFCDPATREKFIPRIAQGEISGSMCLTEPGAGSDVGSLRTSAEKQADGTYLLNGSKMFITNAGGGLAFILARVKGAPKGLDGISMFFAEQLMETGDGKKKQNYRVAKLEEKLGMHGSATCEVVYENTVAHLVGQENEGFKMMLHLMNEARISVGLQAIGGIEASVGYARNYAETRSQFGKTLMELPLYRRNMQDMETERDAFRALMAETVSYYDIYQRLDLKTRHAGELNEKETQLFKRALKVIRRRTPLVKYYGAEAYAALSQKSVQALGGYGFMKEYDAERFHRDCFGALLYEGTSQIQSLMAMKDLVKALIKNPSKFIQVLVSSHPIGHFADDEFRRGFSSVQYEFRKNFAGLLIRCFRPELDITEMGLKDTVTQINRVFRKEYWQDTERFDKLMINAETLCAALSYIETLSVLRRHASKDPSRGELFYRYLKLVTPRLQAVYADWKQG